ncbi:type II toxin-antitoxin system RelE/ParE family toxin [Acidobacteria bacterium AH-259-D05]|nr:type II toxin-antitoxin system RelE/ParE family toxin [Acidobacteria bacterium AH-259-D05]
MTKYRVEISTTAEKRLRKLPRPDQVRIARALVGLATDPFPAHCRKLGATRDVWRIRIGRYRVLYSGDKKQVLIIILKISHRRDVYR